MVEFTKVYLDSSVILRRTLKQPGALTEVNWVSATASELLAVELRRTFDCLRITKAMELEHLATLRDVADRNLTEIALVPLDRAVLNRAGEPFPTPLKTLDAIHLATALLLDVFLGEIVFLTHDRQLGVAARACGLTVYPDPFAPERV